MTLAAAAGAGLCLHGSDLKPLVSNEPHARLWDDGACLDGYGLKARRIPRPAGAVLDGLLGTHCAVR